jgi:hypothetical protein
MEDRGATSAALPITQTADIGELTSTTSSAEHTAASQLYPYPKSPQTTLASKAMAVHNAQQLLHLMLDCTAVQLECNCESDLAAAVPAAESA